MPERNRFESIRKKVVLVTGATGGLGKAVVKRLLDTGVSLQQVRKAMDSLRQMGEPATGTTLVSDGTRIYAVDSPEGVVDLLAKGQGVFALAVDRIWSDLEGMLSRGTKGARAETKKPVHKVAHAGGS